MNTYTLRILGLCNNFAYVVMLSAAKDILEKEHIHQGENCIVSVHTQNIVCQNIVLMCSHIRISRLYCCYR